MRRYLIVLELTDDGITGKEDQDTPVYLLTSAEQAGRYLKGQCDLDAGIIARVKLTEELLP